MLSVLFEEALPEDEIVVPDFVLHVSGRRLEEAVAIQLINGFRLAASSLVCLRTFRDTAKVFFLCLFHMMPHWSRLQVSTIQKSMTR